MAEQGAARRVLVIGAGMAGLRCGRVLADAGFGVCVIDKARGAGGRASARRAGEVSFDHGVQYFKARDPGFIAAVERWMAEGAVAPWEGRIGAVTRGVLAPDPSDAIRFVGTPQMSACLRPLARGLETRFGHRAKALWRAGDAWHVACENGVALGPFMAVVVATPAPQAVPLLVGVPPLAARAAAARIDPCWAVMLGFERALPFALDGAFVGDSPLAWVARDGSKPGRKGGERWVLHATAAYSESHVDDPPEQIVPPLLEAFGEALGCTLPAAIYHDAHRWRYARTRRALDVPYLLDEAQRISACGDYCLGGRLESAWLSGNALGRRLCSVLA
jgi:renalase